MHAWEQIQQTVEYIEEHLDEDLKIENLAKMAALSPFYYQRLFSRLVKKPVSEYVKLRRMAMATEMLHENNRRILDIALDLGFSSHELFTRTFKDTFGMTPDDYRKNPQPLNRMTKPELLLRYAMVDERVPLITNGIVLEINRRKLTTPIHFIGLNKKMPIQFVEGLGVESGVNALVTLWQSLHEQKLAAFGIADDAEEIGVSYPCSEDGYFNYFAGAKSSNTSDIAGSTSWNLPKGDYIVCTFEAEDFESLVMDALHKANQYLFTIWLPSNDLKIEPFNAERYASRTSQTTKMEIWLKIV